MIEGLRDARAIVQARRDQAERERVFHKMTGPRLCNVDATLAAFKVKWLDRVLADIDLYTAELVARQ